MNQRCVLYARLSVTKEESVSISRQLDSCRKYAQARGWQIVGEFVDDGVSATVNRPEDRKGWSDLVRTDAFDAVVIWKVDRLARSVLDFLHVDEALRERGAGLVAVEDPIDMTSPQGRAFGVMLAVFGELEAASIRARVRAARAHLVQTGRFAGGGVPYGYLSIANPAGPGKVLATDQERFGWLSQIVAKARSGESINGITRWLNETKAPLPAKTAARNPNGSWSRQTVDQLLRNPILAGMSARNPGRAKSAKRVDPFAVVRDDAGRPISVDALAVISIEEFAELRRHLDSRDTPQARPFAERQQTSPFLSRVALCDDCEVFMCRGTNQKRPVLQCPRCRQTITRTMLDPYLARRLLRERGALPLGAATVRAHWVAAGHDDSARRQIFLDQLGSLRIRRGVVGRNHDPHRVLLQWRTVDGGES